MDEKNKVLIVDDNIDTVELLRKRLRAEGYETAEAYDGEECLSRVVECNPDVIILDVMMPKMNGYEVCRRLKSDENTKYIPILMLTAKGEVEDKVKGLDVGADDYLAKPFDYKELSARIRSLLATTTAHKKLAEKKRAEALEQVMEEVTHEVRNPLVSIGGFARRVYDNLPEDDPNKKYMEMIIQEVARLEEMIKQLIELKSMAISPIEPADVNDVITEALEIFKDEITKKDIEVRTELMEKPPLVPVDKKQLKRSLCNLIKNSIEAMADTETRILTIVTDRREDFMEIRVSDTGKGIPEGKLKKIFDPFSTSKTHGPGLGLTFSLKIIQEHGGKLSVESEPGKGTTFTVRLPLKYTGRSRTQQQQP